MNWRLHGCLSSFILWKLLIKFSQRIIVYNFVSKFFLLPYDPFGVPVARMFV